MTARQKVMALARERGVEVEVEREDAGWCGRHLSCITLAPSGRWRFPAHRPFEAWETGQIPLGGTRRAWRDVLEMLQAMRRCP